MGRYILRTVLNRLGRADHWIHQPSSNSHTVLSTFHPSSAASHPACSTQTPPSSLRLHTSSRTCPPRPTRLPPPRSTSPAATPPRAASGRRRRATSPRAISTSSPAAGFPSSLRHACPRSSHRACHLRASRTPHGASRRRGRSPAASAPFARRRAPSAWTSRRRSCRPCSACGHLRANKVSNQPAVVQRFSISEFNGSERSRAARLPHFPVTPSLQEYLAHKQQPPARILQSDYV